MRLIDADLIQYEPMLSAKGNGQYEEVSVAYKSQIDDLPTIEKRKRGEWIKMPYHVTECSECGFSLEDWIQGAFYNYCPNCGADMRGEADG